MQEAVLRWAFSNAHTDLDPPAVYCLGVWPHAGSLADEGGQDPDAAMLARFAASAVPVRPVSACRLGGGRHAVVDTASGASGLLFVIGPVIREAGRPVGAEAGYMQDGEWGRGWRCTVERSTIGWSVKECRRITDI